MWSDGYLRASDYDDAVGRLYSQLADGSVVACSATVVAPSVVLTAAHCVYDLTSGQQDTEFLFVPHMRGRNAPDGKWWGEAAYYWSDFETTPETSIDYAFITIDQDPYGDSVGDITGTYGMLEYASPRKIYSEGYPASGPFAARCSSTSCYAWYCWSPLGGTFQDDFGVQFGMGCKTGHGTSGGPWFMHYQGQDYVGSVTSVGVSFHHHHFFRNIWGAQFDSDLDSLLAQADPGY